MACFNPIHGWRAKALSVNGKHSFTISRHEAYVDFPMSIPCGQCIGCRLDRSKAWAVRCMHEAQLHSENCFITLTFDDDHLKHSLSVRDFQLFMKRLRKEISPKKIRFFHAAEYGELLERPHHHSIIFGYDFPDKYLWKINNGVRLFRSPLLEALWPYGFSSIGSVSFDSAAYVARYCLKKINGPVADSHYSKVNVLTGEVSKVLPEFTTMSRRPGIAHDWIIDFHDDVYTKDCVVVRDKFIVRPPKYYDKIYDVIDSDRLAMLKKQRIIKASDNSDNSYERRETKEFIQLRKADALIRQMY
ncbi:MAG: replication initiator protein [Microvirus sp.]|nr:MAG: replication initiator protein [Microvirus sp.]